MTLEWNNRIAALREELLSGCPDHGALEGCATPAEADLTLLNTGQIAEADLLRIYGKHLQYPAAEEEELVCPEKFPGIMQNFLNLNCCIPYRWDDEKAVFLFAVPYGMPQLCYELEQAFGRKIEPLLARRSIVERYITQIYSTQESEDGQLELNPDDEQKLRSLAGEARIVKLVNEMITSAIEQDASDIHIEPGDLQLVIRFRIDGLLCEYMQLPLADFPAIASRVKLIAKLNIAESRRPQDGRINFKTGAHDLDLRFSTIPTLKGESLVMRLLRKDAMSHDLEKLGIPSQILSSFEKLLDLPQGMILVVGPTGSGKTTTLYSSLMRINEPSVKIITVEDPVEYQLPGLNQMQMNPNIGLTFADGLRHILRQDPDVILVGEIRDRETAEIAIQASQTGHLVFSTLHTNDAAGAITRLVDMGIPGFLINSALAGVLSQRLVRRVCTQCGGVPARAGKRCRTCGGTGYKGRIGIYELMVIGEELRNAIRDNCSSTEINAVAVKCGMVPLIECGRGLIRKGITTEEELHNAVAALES